METTVMEMIVASFVAIGFLLSGHFAMVIRQFLARRASALRMPAEGPPTTPPAKILPIIGTLHRQQPVAA